MANKGYTSRGRVENYMLITIDPSFYDQVEEWIGEVESYIDDFTGRNFKADAEASDRVYDGDRSPDLIIDDAVAVTTNGVTIDGDAAGEYLLYPANALPKTRVHLKSGKFPRGDQNVTVNAKWGYSESVPANIVWAATVLLAGIIDYAWNGSGEVQSETIGRYSVTYRTPDGQKDYERAQDILNSYIKQVA